MKGVGQRPATQSSVSMKVKSMPKYLQALVAALLMAVTPAIAQVQNPLRIGVLTDIFGGSKR